MLRRPTVQKSVRGDIGTSVRSIGRRVAAATACRREVYVVSGQRATSRFFATQALLVPVSHAAYLSDTDTWLMCRNARETTLQRPASSLHVGDDLNTAAEWGHGGWRARRRRLLKESTRSVFDTISAHLPTLQQAARTNLCFRLPRSH